MVALTEQEFSKNLKTKFRVSNGSPENNELELVEVKHYSNAVNEQKGMERFSVFFSGPSNSQLEQGTYSLEHEAMGSFDIFLVPIGANQKGMLYEAVFNFSTS